jgi:hypothetical protein
VFINGRKGRVRIVRLEFAGLKRVSVERTA